VSDTAQPETRANIDRADRERVAGQKGAVLWFTGLSGAGKTTIACEVERRLNAAGVHTMRLDGDILREGLTSDLGFSPEDRAENIRRVSEVSALFVRAGVVVLVSAISPYASDRQSARSRVGDNSFFLLYVSTPLEVCESRDPKGLYARARAGEVKDFTGISAPYEAPPEPDFLVDTTGSIDETSANVIDWLRERAIIPAG
jgi:adenylylsulfate kinase